MWWQLQWWLVCAIATSTAGVGLLRGPLDDEPGWAGARILAAARSGLPLDVIPLACGAGPWPDSCRDPALRALQHRGGALLALPVRADSPFMGYLEQHDAQFAGEAAPPTGRACLVRGGPLDHIGASLTELRNKSLAAFYSQPGPECADGEQSSEAVLVAVKAHDADALREAVRALGLAARVVRPPAAERCLRQARAPLLVCAWAPEHDPLYSVNFTRLATPPCTSSLATNCAFADYKLINVYRSDLPDHRILATKFVTNFRMQPHMIRELNDVVDHGFLLQRNAEESARLWAEQNQNVTRGWLPGGAPWPTISLLVPERDADAIVDAVGVSTAGILVQVENDPRLKLTSEFAKTSSDPKKLNVWVREVACSSKNVFDEQMNVIFAKRYSTLTAQAGPPCDGALQSAARLSAALRTPLLSYAPAGPAPGLLRAAGGAVTGTLLRWAEARGWRRLAAISPRSSAAEARQLPRSFDLLLDEELPDGDQFDSKKLQKWAQDAAQRGLRIFLVLGDSVRLVRETLCAAAEVSGLRPRDGAVWLLPRLPPRLLAAGDACPGFIDMVNGSFSAAPVYVHDWRPESYPNWTANWKKYCRYYHSNRSCTEPDHDAALVYDVLTLWADAVGDLQRRRPTVIDNLHDPEIIGELMRNVTSSHFVGLTGSFEWQEPGPDEPGGAARRVDVVVTQWRDGAYHEVAREAGGVLRDTGAIRWRTTNGAQPSDDAAYCALAAVARVLNVECRSASALVLALMVAALSGGVAVVSLHYCRRNQIKYRKRLVQIGAHDPAAEPLPLDRWEIPRERVVINRRIGEGAFGAVYGGHAQLGDGPEWTAVAVKTLREKASVEQKLDFLAEAEAMKRFDHKNVVQLVGVVTRSAPVLTVMEFALYGDLRGYLLARRHLAAGSDPAGEVGARRLTAMALDAARALSYLAERRYVHRDVAARNCLVTASRRLKLADFGMARPFFDNDYYRLGRRGRLPVRWMAPECVQLGHFSPASDMWAYGVLVYEMVTVGEQPYPGLSNSEVVAAVAEGAAPELPAGVKPRLHALLRQCWAARAEQRPRACEVAALLADSPGLVTPRPPAPAPLSPAAVAGSS